MDQFFLNKNGLTYVLNMFSFTLFALGSISKIAHIKNTLL
jgi:hypothetical protein